MRENFTRLMGDISDRAPQVAKAMRLAGSRVQMIGSAVELLGAAARPAAAAVEAVAQGRVRVTLDGGSLRLSIDPPGGAR